MAYLIQHLLLPLLMTAAFGAFAGWCWHCIRNKERIDKLVSTRDRLRMEFAGMTPALPGLRGLGPDPELEAAKMRADVAVAKVVEMERLHADLIADRDSATARVNELEMALAAARASGSGEDWTTRFAALENERDAALRDRDDARQALLARPEPLADTPVETTQPDLETRAQAWRLRLLEGRSEYLESRLSAARATIDKPAQDDPRIGELTTERDGLASEVTRLQGLVSALEKRPVVPTTPAAPENDLNLLRWQSRYLSERVKYLEDQARTPASDEALPAIAPVIAPTQPLVDTEGLNRRAWRQRYLEARLSYFEGRWRDDRTGRIAAMQDLAERTQRLDALSREHTDLRGSAEVSRARLADLESQLDALRRERDAAAERGEGHRQRADALEGRVSAIAGLEAALSEAKTRARDFEAVQAQLAEREAELARLRNQPRTTVDETEVMHLRFRTRFLDDRVKFLEARLAAQPTLRPAAPPRQTFMPAEPSAQEVRPTSLPAARGGAPDDLRLIDGVSPRIESTLNSIGVYHFDQIAHWSDENVAWVERYLAYKGRISRERWVEQARSLETGADVRSPRRFREDEPA